MRKVILNSPGKIEVAVFSRLEKENLIEVVCCLGWQDYQDSKYINIFKNAETDNTWNHFKAGLNGDFDKVDQRFLTPDILDSICWAESIVLDMMDRIDPLKSSTYLERKNLYKYLICYWLGIIDRLKPDVFYTRGSPHEVSDFVLFALCKHLKIIVITFNYTSIPGYVICDDDYRHPWQQLKLSLLNRDDNIESIEQLDGDVRDYILRLRKSYNKASPGYFKEGLASNINKDNDTILFFKYLFRRIREGVRKIRTSILFLISWFSPRVKKRKILSHIRNSISAELVSDEFKYLSDFYNSISFKPNTNIPYVYFALNYQPENTTCPLGGVFNDQALAIALLAKNIPENWLIYVKEHPGQYLEKGYYGYIGRSMQFYKRIMSIKNVKFIPINSDHFDILDNSQCVATITGTIGWEAVVRGKPVLVFGEAWYQDAPYVFRVKKQHDCENALQKIIRFTSQNETELVKYISAVTDSGIKIDFEEYEARWNGRKFDFNKNKQSLYEILKLKLI